MSENGSFKKKKVYFSQVSNNALRDNKLSLKAKGLYALIQSYITIEDFILYKTTLKKNCIEGEKAFESAWKELKDNGYLVQYKYRVSDGTFKYEYELLDEKQEKNNHTPKKEGVDNVGGGKGGSYNNTDSSDTDSNNTDGNIGGIREGLPTGKTHSIPYYDYLLEEIKNYRTDYKSEIIETIIYYHGKYYDKFKEEHIRYKEESRKHVYSRLDYLFEVGVQDEKYDRVIPIDLETIKLIIDKHFETNYSGTMSWTLIGFLNDNILKNRCYEVGCVI